MVEDPRERGRAEDEDEFAPIPFIPVLGTCSLPRDTGRRERESPGVDIDDLVARASGVARKRELRPGGGGAFAGVVRDVTAVRRFTGVALTPAWFIL